MANPEQPEEILTVGEALILFQGDRVHVLGSQGTEATFPAADLEAFITYLAYLARRAEPPETASGGA